MKRFPPIIADMPHMIHGADYNPEQWIKHKDTIWPEDMRLGKLAQMNSLSVGIFSWVMLEPSEGVYNFEWLDEVMDNLASNGMKAVLATPSGARPAWMSAKYPEVLRVESDRMRNLHGSRHNHCMTSPVYREKVRIINGMLAERYKDHPALGLWHISNEYNGECHCPLCQEAFRTYLKDKYQTLDAVNDAWWTSFWSHTYTDWSQIQSPSPYPKGESDIHGLILDWKSFTAAQTVDFCMNEMKPLRHFTPNIPCTTNLMAADIRLNYVPLAAAVDVVSWDNYPQWTNRQKEDIQIACETGFYHDLMYGLHRKPFLIMESCPSVTNWRDVAKLHRPGVHILQSIQAVAHGADSIQYFQMRKGRGGSEKMHGAVIDHEGTENNRVFREIAKLGEILSGLDHIVGASKPSRVALIHDYVNAWAVNEVRGPLKYGKNYHKTLIEHYSAFWNAGVPVDIIDETKSLDGYSLVVAPMIYMLHGDFAQRVTDFVKNGGAFVTTYLSGYVNDTDLCFLGGFPGPLKEILGIWAEELDSLYPEDSNSFVYDGKEYEAREFCELIHARGADVLSVYGSDFYAGMPALTCNSYGKGSAYYIAARTGTDFLDDFYGKLLRGYNIERYPSNVPGVNIQSRTDGVNTYLFVMNFTSETQDVTVNDGTKLTLSPHGYEIITL